MRKKPCPAARSLGDLLAAVGLVGSHPSFIAAAREAIAVSPFPELSVLIEGPSGSGKEAFAKLIHLASGRAGPFVALSCANLTAELAEADLFGAERGAFTGSVRLRKGAFELAEGGTLFLDEIGDLAPELQKRLLRVLQERVLRRVGAQVEIAVDVRIVCATWRDLHAMTLAGAFRQDLLYRINGHTITLPELSDRGDDVILLARHILATDSVCTINGGCVLSSKAEQMLPQLPWPGNVRQLQSLLRTARVFSESGVINSPQLEAVYRRHVGPWPVSPTRPKVSELNRPTLTGDATPTRATEIVERCVLPSRIGQDPLPRPEASGSSTPGSSDRGSSALPVWQTVAQDSNSLWLGTRAVAEIANIEPRVVRKAVARALKGLEWRGSVLKVREVEVPGGSGRNGMCYEILASTLPSHLHVRAQEYLAHPRSNSKPRCSAELGQPVANTHSGSEASPAHQEEPP